MANSSGPNRVGFRPATTGPRFRSTEAVCRAYCSRPRSRALAPIATWLQGRNQRDVRGLDVGCGTGRLLASLHGAWPGLKLTGIDLSAPYLGEARRLIGARKLSPVELLRSCRARADKVNHAVKALTDVKGVIAVSQDEATKRLVVSYQDPTTTPSMFTVASLGALATRSAWTQLTDPNPWVREQIALGEETEVTWTSKDGKKVGGVLLKPVGYTPGKKYPLIVAIHGGPAAADQLSFNGGYGAQVYAGQGWAVLMPNYRGSTNYGEAHKNGIVGNYFEPGYNDIMTGVDALIAQGLVDETKMGVLGWSAGGHWSNWILTHTDRFKGISSGAGTSNWISMYAQSDVQRNRQYYLGNKLPYDDFDAYWKQSPIKYIRNAKTPTMIHVVEGDPRVPSPQSVELHMGLKRVGVPTELFMYPGASHGIPDARNRLVKSAAEMAWMNYWVLGNGKKFSWREVLETLEDPKAEKKVEVKGIN